jgi:alpha-beta hydrolase superfamily lysophospholipase
MQNTFSLQSRRDSLQISCLATYPSEGIEPKGIVQFAHGMCEHKERYLPFMEFLSSNGYICVINDHRGHGESVLCSEDLGYFYTGGYEALVDDLLLVNQEMKKLHPGLPCHLFGHSMGSLAVRSYTKRYDDTIDSLIVCGSPSANPAAGAGKLLTRLIAAIKGDRHRPAIIQKMAFDGYNKKFSTEGPNAWLSTEKENVRIYNESPLCGYTFTANGFIGLFNLMQDTYSDKGWKVSKPALPIHFIAGSEDPCIVSLKDFDKAVSHMKSHGYTKVTSKAYEGLRHEILNETGKQAIWDDVLQHLEGLEK